jgi:ketosteroid isomerase-like protein
MAASPRNSEMAEASPTPLDVVRAYFAAINQARLDDLAAVFAEDATLDFPMFPRIHGRQAIRDFYASVLTAYPDHSDQVTDFFTGEGGGVAARIHFVGKTAEGRPVAFDAVDLFRVSGAEIAELHIFYDSVRVLEMIGKLPQNLSGGAR